MSERDERFIVLSGATRGLGRALTDGFAARGHRVLGCGRTARRVEELAATHGAPHDFARVDVADDDAGRAWAERLLAEHGPPDLLLNNAALMNDPAPATGGQTGRRSSPKRSGYGMRPDGGILSGDPGRERFGGAPRRNVMSRWRRTIRLGLAALLALAAGCEGASTGDAVCGDAICEGDETPLTCEFDCEPCLEDGVCDPEWGENRTTCPVDCPLCNDDGNCEFLEGEDGLNCPGDCLPAGCSLETITPQNAPSDYLVSAFRVPTSASEARDVGCDLDGDGNIDNRLGEVVGMFASQADPNTFINGDIASGDMVLLGRVYVDSHPDDDMVIVQMFEGLPTESPPTFDGTDVLEIAPDYPQTLYLCGTLAGGSVDAGPGTLMVPFPLPGVDTVFVTVHQTRMEGQLTADDWTDMMLGGGITRQELETVVLPAVADYLNRVIEQDPWGDTAQQLLGFFDAQCSRDVEGCEDVVLNEGDCAPNHPDQGPWITTTEVRCNLLFDGVMQPDVDSDGDGDNDLISLGIRVDAVHATITGM